MTEEHPGSVWYLAKPVTEAELLASIAAACPSSAESSKTILLADDAEEMRALVQAFLGAAHQVDWAGHGQAALDKFKAGRYHLVVTDIEMPGMDGRALIAAIRAWEQESNTPATPIVVLSGVSSPGGATPPSGVTAMPDDEILAIVPAFLDARRDDVHALTRALASGDYARIQTIGHRLKGTGRSYGFDDISEIGRALEEAGTAGSPDAAARHIDALRAYLECVQILRSPEQLSPGEEAHGVRDEQRHQDAPGERDPRREQA
jgi:CheY-like chemotaxis protein